jgi:hypothetical protein
MGRILPACMVILGLMLSACSKPRAQQTSVTTGPSSPSVQPVQPIAATQPVAPAAQSSAAPAAPGGQSSTTPTSPERIPPSQSASNPSLVASDETQGPFHIADQTFTFVKQVEKIRDSKSSDDVSVEWWELRDSTGKAVYRQQYGLEFQNGSFQDTEDVTARELKTKFGHGILLEGSSLPSAPNSGWWVQVFGLFDGKLVPFSAPISTDGEFLEEDVATYQPTAVFRGQQQAPVSHDVLKFRMWTGNFNLHYNVIIDWLQAKVRPEWICSQMTAGGRSSACRYPVDAESNRNSEMSFIRLFGEPDEGFTPKHVVIKPESKIEFIEAQSPVGWSADQNNAGFSVTNSEKIWLHIKVDGQDGWICGEEDFEAVGLPQSG